MSDEENADAPMAECGACRAIIPLDSDSCPECNIRFGGVSDEALGECGACGSLQPIDAAKCSNCNVAFVADDVIGVLGSWLTITGISIQGLFERFDTDGNGEISADEFKEGLLSLKLADLPPSQIDRLVEIIDSDGNGTIDIGELAETFGQSTTDSPAKEEKSEEEDSDDSDAEEVAKEEETTEEEDSDDNDSEDEEDSEDSDDEEAADDSDEDDSGDEDEDDSDDDDEDDSDDDDEDDSEEEKDEAEDDDMAPFRRLAQAIADSDMDIPTAFDAIDTNDDGRINGPELQAGILEIGGEFLSPGDVHAIIKTLDEDDDGHLDPMELVNALEGLKEEEKPAKKEKEFPSNLQRMMMSKKANDIYYPIIHFLMVCFIGVWIINGVGLIVDGTGGTIVYEGHTDQYGVDVEQAWYDGGQVSIGETYPCDPDIDPNKCANSLTPFSGDSSSMPAGFYLDGIIMIILGIIGFAGGLWLHLKHAPALRELAKGSDDKSEDSEDGDDDDDDDDDEDDIDIGDRIGLEIDDKEYFGEIVEFDDENETVTIETDDGDEITGDQDDMFFEDDD